jgi:hypothetical protein
MAKRIIRLTESDLTRIVRRVIKEQQTKYDADLLKCAQNQVQITDINEIPPFCKSVGVDLMMGNTPSVDSFTNCVKQAAEKDPRWVKDKAIGFMTCVAEKKGINIGSIVSSIGGMVTDIFNKITSGISKGPGPMY